MLTWLLLGTGLYLLSLYIPSLFLISRIGVAGDLGNRDAVPESRKAHGRASRAAANNIENYPVFMGLGVLAFAIEGADMSLATTGAMLFVLGRAAFWLVYLIGIPYLRSAIFMVALFGMILMAWALL